MLLINRPATSLREHIYLSSFSGLQHTDQRELSARVTVHQFEVHNGRLKRFRDERIHHLEIVGEETQRKAF